jgi:diguanylate cyclase (GGDEF)-like protein/PAS domain S-box-containing protein
VSPSVKALLGYEVDEFLSRPTMSLMHPDELATARSLLADISSEARSEGVSTYRLRHKSGEYRFFEVRWSVQRTEGGAITLHTTGHDVTERVRAEETLARQAEQLLALSLRDELTKLYNRRGFLEVAGQAELQAARDGRPAALLFFDLNGMKRINDELGHDAGDDALVDTAAVLRTALHDGDVIARLGGDEFVAYALDFTPEQLDVFRRRIRELADAEVGRRARSYRLSMSVGAAFSDASQRRSLEQLLDEADQEMYEQKRARRNAGNVSLLPPARRS